MYMTKTMILSLIDKLSKAYKTLFATKTELNTAISTLDTSISNVNTSVADLQQQLVNLGTFVGAADTYAALPTTDKAGNNIAAGDLAYLNANDGDHKLGLYKYDGTNYVWLATASQAQDILAQLKATTLDDTVDDKFVTPKWVKDYNDSQEPTQDEVNTTVNAA